MMKMEVLINSVFTSFKSGFTLSKGSVAELKELMETLPELDRPLHDLLPGELAKNSQMLVSQHPDVSAKTLVIGYILREILDLAIFLVKERGDTSVEVRHIAEIVRCDSELAELFV